MSVGALYVPDRTLDGHLVAHRQRGNAFDLRVATGKMEDQVLNGVDTEPLQCLSVLGAEPRQALHRVVQLQGRLAPTMRRAVRPTTGCGAACCSRRNLTLRRAGRFVRASCR